ncbi:hypothetical protein DFH07DRAFT_955881 [Mycena maculata]|uniref:CxC1-like cysteine cluster associated with KDZ transposases domain-containing protein n=1 Tax=Mycena maculata TaxID=230809 RepID=A0AAD7NL65_9AGAR|nr:hypothetical protein DFH07DRAFT_955881 [Mycena maculata]
MLGKRDIKPGRALLRLENHHGYLLLAAPLTPDNLEKKCVTVYGLGGGVLQMPGAVAVKPLRELEDGSSILSSNGCVIVIGPDVEGDELQGVLRASPALRCSPLRNMRWNNQDVEEVRNPSPHRAEPIVRPGLFEVPRAGNALKRYPPMTTPLIFYSNGQTLSQPLHRAPLGQVGWHDTSVSDGPLTPSRERQHPDVALPGDEHITTDFLASQSLPRSAALKKNNQWRRWSTDVIPQLVPIFIELMHATKCLRDTSELLLEAAPCTCTKRALYVAIVRMNAIEHTRLSICPCSPAPSQLLRAGLFACSPLRPSLAVDLQVLDFAMRLFVNVPPNNTAFCNTLEGFLSSRGYKLTATAQQPTSTSPTPSPAPPTTNPGTPAATWPVPQNPSRAHQKRRRAGDNDNEVAEPTPNSFPTPEPRTSPSDYLISRCPACFGGLVHDRTADVDIHVCANACFMQKRRWKGSRWDPPRSHPRTVFIPEPTANKMSVYVEEVRPPTARAPAKRACQDEAEDEYEDVTLIKFFDDTGLMGLLCWHNRVLWLVNMCTAGEKQYYVLVLLETLFQHLPSNICWGFLDRYMDRIWFAVSVFHAFGHRWPCQLIYHPLKCCGFGHTNGEGCERFWHSISKLIAYLRVSGYHLHLYTIDSQIEHADKMSLGRLASWILRQTAHCEGKLKDAVAELQTCGSKQSHWRGAPKLGGLTVVEQVLEARSKVTLLFEQMTHMEEALQDDKTPTDERLYANMNHADTQEAWKQQKERVARLERDLGVNHSTALKKLEHSEYYTARMNAKALKERLRAKLRDRKFELDPIERSVRRTASENQRNEHAGQAIKRRDPNISKLMTAYNKSCDDIAKLIAAKKAPRSAVAPAQVAKSLYKLNVDNIIWQDVGLDEDNDDDTAPPLWLSDNNVRTGIQAMLQKDR